MQVYRWSKNLSAVEYATGLRSIQPRMNDIQRRLLLAQYSAPKRTAYATQLAQLASVGGGHPTVNAQYGRLGRMFCEASGHEPDIRNDGTSRWWSTWSLGHSTPKGFIWEMLPAVAEALELLGWIGEDELRFAEEIRFDNALESSVLTEGGLRRVLVNAYERNSAARVECIRHYGTNCVICGFDFGAVYGPLAKDFIHVHHLVAISTNDGETHVVDPIADLRPVCPNCHAVIHLGGKTRSIEDVRCLVRRIGGSC